MDRLAEILKEFIECKHKYWKCTECGCVASTGTVAFEYIQRINELEELIEELQREKK
jgi:hypothetical protein